MPFVLGASPLHLPLTCLPPFCECSQLGQSGAGRHLRDAGVLFAVGSLALLKATRGSSSSATRCPAFRVCPLHRENKRIKKTTRRLRTRERRANSMLEDNMPEDKELKCQVLQITLMCLPPFPPSRHRPVSRSPSFNRNCGNSETALAQMREQHCDFRD